MVHISFLYLHFTLPKRVAPSKGRGYKIFEPITYQPPTMGGPYFRGRNDSYLLLLLYAANENVSIFWRRQPPSFLRGCAGTATIRERKATPQACSTGRKSGQSGVWGDPNERIGKSQRDIPIHCSPMVSRIRNTPLCYLNSPQKTVFTSVL